MQHNKNIPNDLEYLAELGYGSFPGAQKDVTELQQKIKTRAGSGAIGSNFIALLIGLFIGITVFFTIYNTPSLFPSRTEAIADNNLKPEVKKMDLDTVTIRSPFKIPHVVSEKFIEPVESDSVITIHPLESIATVSTNAENDIIPELKYSPNATIIYLHDLKIANYNVYYFTGQKHIIIHRHLDPDKAYRNNQGTLNDRLNKDYYLHEAIDDAMKAFKKQKYGECLALLNTVAEKSKNDVNCDFYRGMCYYYLHNYEQAYDLLNSALTNNINVFAEESSFYLALSALKTKRTEEGKKMLEEIAGLNGFYALKAKEQLAK